MPTSVSIVRQCLANEAVHALDEAVTKARRRGHAQTTSLHLVSSLLSLPTSPLSEACSRIRNDAFALRLQFKALELSLSVSLDRLPSALSGVEEPEPPVSNSLMAAIKRSQAIQRRQPENFSFYQQQMLSSSSSSSITVVKVELQNLILSILDDPVVSRVFGDAGFRSYEIKVAILRQVHQLLRYSRNKWPREPPPLFLCNLNGDNNHLRRKGFSFPFIGFSEFTDSKENCRRIAEVMEKNDGNSRRNPLLVGACAFDSLRSFLGMIQGRRERNELPRQLTRLSVISVEDDILKFVTGKFEECLMRLKFEEIGKTVGNCVAPGVVINFGDLNALAFDNASIDTLRFIVCELTKLLEIHGSKVWLIGAAATYEAYLKFSQLFPSAEMDLDLQLLPITATRISMAKSYPRSSSSQRQFPYHMFDEKCHQEAADLNSNKTRHHPSSFVSLESNNGNGLKSPEAADLNLELKTACTKALGLDWRDFKLLYTSLTKRISWQEEAVKVISETIVHSKSNPGNTWFIFLGPDQLGKRKLAIALAEILYGNQENLIHLDLNRSNSILNLESAWDSYDLIGRGRNIVDYIVDQLRNKPFSVVLLENIEKSDLLVQQSLSHAVKNDRFLDSYGREISINNTIFITTNNAAAVDDCTKKLHSETPIYSEDDLSSVKAFPIHITIGIDLRETVKCASSNKRKHETNERKRCVHKSLDTYLDLNIPLEEEDIVEKNDAKWLGDFVGKVDAKVVFKPFDYDALGNNILKDVTEEFQKTVGLECCLEIDYKVMVQMISSGYVDSEKSVEDWVQTILRKGFEEAQEKYSLTYCSIVKLVAGEGIVANEQLIAHFLPSKIIVH